MKKNNQKSINFIWEMKWKIKKRISKEISNSITVFN